MKFSKKYQGDGETRGLGDEGTGRLGDEGTTRGRGDLLLN